MSAPELVLRSLLLNDHPVECTNCGSVGSLTLDQRGVRETWPAWIGCTACGHGEDHQTITNGLVAAAAESRTGREKAVDRDLFAAEWRGLVLAGECVPELVADDIRAVAGVLADIGRQEIRERKREAKRWWRSKKATAKKAGRRAVRQAAGTVTSTALTAAWDRQSQGAQPPKPARGRCRAKGCRGGWLTVTTRAHGNGGRPEEVRVPCGVCHRAI